MIACALIRPTHENMEVDLYVNVCVTEQTILSSNHKLWDVIAPSHFYKSFLLFTASLVQLAQIFYSFIHMRKLVAAFKKKVAPVLVQFR
ncbi:Uncharacterised protein [Legionella lansingensis]|uniref:Uncharacterized protein n=1 Tax=Legionella lansingensis TaxID=45067 RepID=A0A0W0VG79_9GAMM|nr:hypothetical protein Llan_2393 [Legionella lansingensis]SNV43121.1 Uncharacterised protein [Legionella lansingensis]